MKLACPLCQKTNQISPPDDIMICSHCSSSFQIGSGRINQVFTFTPKLKGEELFDLIQNYWHNIDFKENTQITDITPIYFPFWQSEQGVLLRASSKFHPARIKPPSSTKICFDRDQIDSLITIAEVEINPWPKTSPHLYYLPFFKVSISHRDHTFILFINAMNGEIYADKIPFFSIKNFLKLFPLFISLLLFLLVNNLLFGPILIVMPINFLALLLFYHYVQSLNGKNNNVNVS